MNIILNKKKMKLISYYEYKILLFKKYRMQCNPLDIEFFSSVLFELTFDSDSEITHFAPISTKFAVEFQPFFYRFIFKEFFNIAKVLNNFCEQSMIL